MVEVVFSYGVSHQLLRERLHAAERAGLVLVLVGVMALCLQL
jgi:multidrug transporter EmrE-like cation transporter